MRTVIVVRVAILLVAGCHGSGRAEAASLDDAVDRYRRAVGVQRAAELQAVADLPCSNPDVCDTKKTCLAALSPTNRALEIRDEVTLALADLQAQRLSPDSGPAQALPAKLDEAKGLLEEGRARMDDCEKKLADLRLHYGR